VTSNGLGPRPLHYSLASLLALALSASSAGAQAPPPSPPVTAIAPVTLTLADATARALAANPAALARALDRGIAAADLDIARERLNPDFTYESTRDAPTNAFVVTQPFELGSKRARRVAASEASRQVVEADLARDAADLSGNVRRAFYRLLAADSRATVARELASMAGRARDAAKARVDSGEAPRLDQVQADLVLARATNLAATASGERAALEAELDALIGLPSGTPLVVTGDLFNDGLAAASTPTGAAGPANVDIAAAVRRTAAATAAVDLARAQRVPDVALAGGLTYNAPPDFTYGWKAGLSLTVPLFTTHRAEVVRAEQVALQAARLQTAISADLDGRSAAAARRAGVLAEAVRRTTRDILPAAATVTDMAQASYESGQTGMVSLIQSLQTVAETRLEAVETALSFQLALADLERARGVTLP
jgi:cobalt-zinc-cadmium efflux system outer membrane protein